MVLAPVFAFSVFYRYIGFHIGEQSGLFKVSGQAVQANESGGRPDSALKGYLVGFGSVVLHAPSGECCTLSSSSVLRNLDI